MTRPPDPEGRTERRTILAACALLALAVAAVHGRTLGFAFIPADDEGYVYGNPAVRQGLTLAGVRYALASLQAANWHPLAWLSHMADVSLFGLAPAGHHGTNVLLHGANAVLLFLVLRRMTGAAGPSAFAAALFAVHPLNVESVAWVCERKNLLSLLFFLLMLRGWDGWARGGSRRGYAAALGCHALGLMAKPMGVTAPFVLLLLDHWPFRRLPGGGGEGPSGAEGGDGGATPSPGWGRLLLEKAPFLALSAASSAVTLVAQSRGDALGEIPPPLRLANAARSYLLYLSDAAWPRGLSFFYPYPAGGIALWKTAAAATFLVAATAAALRLRRRLPWLPVGWLWYLGTLVPMIGLVQAGRQAMADRYMYLPGIGLFLLAAWGGAEGAGRLPERARRLVPAAAGAALLALGAAAFVQAGHWRDETTLLSRAVALDPDNAFAHQNLSIAFAERGDHGASLRHQREALRIEPGNPKYAVNLAAATFRAGRPADAETLLREVVAVFPEYPKGHVELGRMLALRGAWDGAETELRAAARLEPQSGAVRRHLGSVLSRAGKGEEGIAELREALRLEPGSAEGMRDLGAALARAGRPGEGTPLLREAVRLAPDDAEGWHLLGAALDLLGRPAEAVPCYRRAAAIHPGHVPTLVRLALSLARAGERGEAERILSEVAAALPGDEGVRGALEAVRAGEARR